jgi:hypothetical protein
MINVLNDERRYGRLFGLENYLPLALSHFSIVAISFS